MKNSLIIMWLYLMVLLPLNVRCQQENIGFDKNNFKHDLEGFNEAYGNLLDGDDYYEQGGGGYKFALENYMTANGFNPHNAELNYKIGVCYLLGTLDEKCLDFFLKSHELDSDRFEDIHFVIGQGYQLRHDFDSAIAHYREFENSLSNALKKRWAKRIEKRIAECNYGKEIVSKPITVLVENLGNMVNSEFSDHSPLISADEYTMVFTSKRMNTTGGLMDPFNLEYFEDIYITYNVNGQWLEAENIGPPVNTVDHNASIGFSADGQQMYIYEGKVNRGDIYVCVLEGTIWTKPKPLPSSINSELQETSACMSFDGKTIYFVSDRIENNYGRKDIYYSKKNKKEQWENAKNIGTVINTEYDEEGVFIHPNGKTLFFSSKGHSSMGGYDIFKSIIDSSGNWSKPVNIGYPINTASDEVFFVMSADGNHGYMSSSMEGGYGQEDIYRITFVRDTISIDSTIHEDAQLTLLKGTIIDQITLEPIEAIIEVYDIITKEIIATYKSNSKTGRYLLSLPAGKNYGVTIKAPGYLFHSENFANEDLEVFNKVEKEIAITKVDIGAKVILNNIFFEYAKAELDEKSTMELNRLVDVMKEYPGILVEIGGHTDNSGTLATNEKLSNDRAKAVLDYLTEKGMQKNRMQHKGYAFSMPVASNDTEEGRSLNRRVEFTIIKK